MLEFWISFGAWAVVHSVTASAAFKHWVRARLGARRYHGFYRLGYNVFATLSLLPAAYYWLRLPDTAIWSVKGVWALALTAVRLFGLVGALYSLWQTDIWDFVGLRQVFDYVNGRSEPKPERQRLTDTLVVSGAYAWMRHPLYTFSLLILWATPTLTRNGLILNVAFTLYFWIGSIFEERRLANRFGAAYRRYQERVPRFIPRL